jgi:hypothetical protein
MLLPTGPGVNRARDRAFLALVGALCQLRRDDGVDLR